MIRQAAGASPLPPLQYFMVVWSVDEAFGGMTTMSLYRAGMFERLAGVSVPVLTFNANPGHASLMRKLEAAGKVASGSRVLNVFQHYRAADLGGHAALGRRWRVPRDRGKKGAAEVTRDSDGNVFSRTWRRPDGEAVAQRIFYRPDGTQFLRDETPRGARGTALGRYVTLLGEGGRVVGGWRSAWAFYRHWLRELAADDPTAIIVDSRYAARFVAGLDDEHIIKLTVLHNNHVARGADPYHGPLGGGQKPIHEDLAAWDGVIFLSRTQLQHYVVRFGSSTNLFTISNPKPRVATPAPFDGRPVNRGVVVGRLHPQKNLSQAVEVMALVRKRLPDAVLDIYGSGELEGELREQITALGLQDTVQLRGHVQGAAAAFDTARYSLLTSRYEGQPLALMESLGRGCPPVSYDIRYGPGDLIEDGVNGFLVEEGDIAAAADRIVRLCTDDDLAERLGRQAWESSARFDDAAVFARWSEVLTRAWAQRAARVRISGLRLLQRELSLLVGGGVEIVGDVLWEQTSGPALEDLLRVHLVVGRRFSGKPEFVPAAVTGADPGRVRFSAVADAAALSRGVPDGCTRLDLFVQVQGRNVLRSFRVGFPVAVEGRRPYATVHGGLSLTALGTQPPRSRWRPFSSKRSRPA